MGKHTHTQEDNSKYSLKKFGCESVIFPSGLAQGSEALL
jgi:hypothetical protein